MFLEWVFIGLVPFLTAIVFSQKMRNTAIFYLKYVIFCIYLILVAIFGTPFALLNPHNCKSMWWYAYLLKPVSVILGINWKIRNAENISDDDESAIIISNHQSMYDILGMVNLWQLRSIRCVSIAKKELFWLWPVGLAMWFGGVVFIKRGGSVKTKQHINEEAKQIFKEKNKLWIYVEGTRNKNPEQLLPFKKGAFRLAIEHQIPIIPILFSPYYFINWKKKQFNSGTVILEILKPIQTTDLKMENLDDLIEKIYGIMSSKNTDLREEVKQLTKINN